MTPSIHSSHSEFHYRLYESKTCSFRLFEYRRTVRFKEALKNLGEEAQREIREYQIVIDKINEDIDMENNEKKYSANDMQRGLVISFVGAVFVAIIGSYSLTRFTHADNSETDISKSISTLNAGVAVSQTEIKNIDKNVTGLNEDVKFIRQNMASKAEVESLRLETKADIKNLQNDMDARFNKLEMLLKQKK